MAETVKVGCRLPSGVILRVSEWGKDPDGNSFLKEIAAHAISGTQQHMGPVAGGMHPEDSASFTEMPADHWAKWLEMNKDSDLVTSGAVYEASDEDVKKTEERESERAAEHKDADAPEPAPAAPSEPAADLRGGPVRMGDSPVDHTPSHHDHEVEVKGPESKV